MNRNYQNGNHDEVLMFLGTEVENTPAKGMTTLFLVGNTFSPDEIEKLAGTFGAKHLYFGANQSFKLSKEESFLEAEEQLNAWSTLIKDMLSRGYLCTLDFDVSYINEVLETGLCEFDDFIPQISVKIPYLQLLGYNATLKIDDIDFARSNPGVWCHSLHDLTSKSTFTSWRKYGMDQIVKVEEK